MSNKFVVGLFCILIFVTSFDIVFYENLPLPIIYSFLKVIDEVFIAIFFVIMFSRKRKKNTKILYLLTILAIIGFIGNIQSHSSIKVAILGVFSTVKPILLYWCLTQFDFEWINLKMFCRYIIVIFPLAFFSYILDIFIPSFRYDIGIVAQAEEIRMGLRSLGGLFNRFTNATMYALLFFLIYKYYYPSKIAKFKVIFADFMIISSLKVKDILGFVIARAFGCFHRFKMGYMVIIGVIFVGLFALYATLMPEHYTNYFESDEDSNVARVVLNYTSLKIAVDKFPFGVGYGLYASPTSQQIESPIYENYGIDMVYGLSYEHDNGVFMADVFWPMILGETGILGIIVYICILYCVFGCYIKNFLKDTSNPCYVMPAFLFIVYLCISIGKPVFAGPPHALVLWGIAGIFYSLKDKPFNLNIKK